MADTIDEPSEEIEAMDSIRHDLAANVSHDLRTPLVSIHGYVETILMKSKTLTEEELHRYLTTVLQSTGEAQEARRRIVRAFKARSQTNPAKAGAVFSRRAGARRHVQISDPC